ncbi:hypothetical protein M0638_28380, partial [Roseomonas sp. NAR14]
EALRVANRTSGGAEARRAAQAAAFRALNAARAALRRAEVALHGPQPRPVLARRPRQAPARRVPTVPAGLGESTACLLSQQLAGGAQPIAQPAPAAV